MRLYSSIALAAVAAMLVTPVAAEAKTKKHHHAAAAAPEGLTTAEQLRLAQEQISQLQAQLNAVAAKLDSTASVAATQSQLAAANSAAATASTKADRALAAADAVKVAEVKTEKAVSLSSWAQGTQVHGRMYFNTSVIDGHNAAGAAVERDGGFQIKRAYISVDHQFNKTFAFDVTMDADNVLKSVKAPSIVTTCTAASPPVCTNTNGANNGIEANTGQGFYIKKAYLEAKINPALVVRLGSADMPWIPFVEGLYGYRHVEKTLIDLNGYGTSADWGVHVGGSLFNNVVSYQVSAIDGNGYRNPQLGQHVDVEGRLNATYMGFTAGIGGYVGKLGAAINPGTTFTNNVAEPGVTAPTANRFDAVLAYKGKVAALPFTLGGEYLWAKDFTQNQVAGYDLTVAPTAAAASSNTLLINGKYYKPVGEDTETGFTLFGSVSPMPKWSIFGRYDWIKSNGYTAPAKRDHYFNVGLQYEPVSIVDLALVYKRDNGKGSIATGNLPSGQATRDEIGLFGQVRF